MATARVGVETGAVETAVAELAAPRVPTAMGADVASSGTGREAEGQEGRRVVPTAAGGRETAVAMAPVALEMVV